MLTYVDSSVALAQLLSELRSPPEAFWHQPLVSSRLLEYEVWNRIHAYGLTDSRGNDTRALLNLVGLVELNETVLGRALRPYPVRVRTLDGLHLATIEALRSRGDPIELASYDGRLTIAARALGVPLAGL